MFMLTKTSLHSKLLSLIIAFYTTGIWGAYAKREERKARCKENEKATS